MLEQYDGQNLPCSQGGDDSVRGEFFFKIDVVPATLITGDAAEKLSHKNKVKVTKNIRRE